MFNDINIVAESKISCYRETIEYFKKKYNTKINSNILTIINYEQ